MPRSLRPLLPACIAALVSAAPAAADTVLGETARPTPVSAYAGHVAWSEYVPPADDDPSVPRGHFRLMLSVDGLPGDPVAVAPRRVPFDVDLGPGPGGGVDAVYSRCRDEPQLERDGGVLPAWNSGGGCDLYRVDLDTGLEIRLSDASTPGTSEYLPSLWRFRLAFARRYEGRAGARGRYPYLYHRSLASARASRRLPGGGRGIGPTAATTGQPAAVDLRRGRAAFTWNRVDRRDGRPTARSALRSVTLSGRVGLREAAWFPGGGGWLAPTQETEAAVVSGVLRLSPPFDELRRYRLGSDAPAARRDATEGGDRVLALSRDHAVSGARGTYALVGRTQPARGCVPACRVVRLEPDPLAP